MHGCASLGGVCQRVVQPERWVFTSKEELAMEQREAEKLVPMHVLTAITSQNDRKGVVGIGITIRERQADGKFGAVVYRHSEWHARLYTDEADAIAVVRALEIALERGISRVLVCSHYRPRGERRRGERRDKLPLDPVRVRVRELAARFALVHFGLVARDKKGAARKLARGARVKALAQIKRGRNCRQDHPNYDHPDFMVELENFWKDFSPYEDDGLHLENDELHVEDDGLPLDDHGLPLDDDGLHLDDDIPF